MDVWQLIRRDHANIEHLIHEAPSAFNRPGAARGRELLLADLIGQLETHAEAMSVSLYAPLGRQPQTKNLIDELYDEHREFTRQLADLARFRWKGSEGWINAFDDATFLVDQHLHRLKHELLPAAQELLSEKEANNAARTFVQVKQWAAQSRRRPEPAPRSELDLKVIVCTLAVGLGYVLWQSGFLGSHSRAGRRTASTSGQRGVNPATASIPARRDTSSIGRDRQERLLDDGLEETFPASDPVSAQRFT